MKIVVNDAKVRAELWSGKPQRDRRAQCAKLTTSEVELLIARLGALKMQEVGERLGKSLHTVSQAFTRIREALCVDNDMQLAYLAYERGYVVIEDER